MKKGLEGYRVHTNKGNGFRVIRLHYTADPDKRSPEWKKETRKDFFGSDEAWQREYEIDFEAKAGKPVFRAFKFERNVEPLKFFPKWNIVRGWDFGYHNPACVFVQIDTLMNRVRVLRELQGEDEYIWDFRDRVKNITTDNYKDCLFEDYCDYHGIDRRDVSEKTSIDFLREVGFEPIGIRAGREQRIEVINYLLSRICPDGKPALLIDPSCTKFISGLNGGLVYRIPKEGEQPKDEIDLQSDYIHLNDAFWYILSAKPELHPQFRVGKTETYEPLYPYLVGSGDRV